MVEMPFYFINEYQINTIMDDIQYLSYQFNIAAKNSKWWPK